MLFGFKHFAMVELLRGAVIVWIQLHDGSQLLVGEAGCGLQNVPGNSLSAGRRGERAAIGVVAVVRRHKVLYIS